MAEKFTLDQIYEMKCIVGFDCIDEVYKSLTNDGDRYSFLETLNEYYDTEHWKKMPGYREE